MPVGALSSVDLRSLPQCAQPSTPDGVGLFVTANATNLGQDYTNLGTDPQVVLSGAQKSALQTLLNLPNPIAANTLQDAIWEAFAIQADPTGEDRLMPLVPCMRSAEDPRCRWELWLGGQRVRTLRFSAGASEAVALLDLLKRQYRAHRERSLGGEEPPTHYRKVCGYWVRKFRIHYRNFQPIDLPDEPHLPPDTTITESFNQSDSSTLGPDLSWTEYLDAGAGDGYETVSNEIVVKNTGVQVGYARAESDLSSDDHYAQITVTAIPTVTSNEQFGVRARFDAGGISGYDARAASYASGTNQIILSKQVGGTQTNFFMTAATLSGLPKALKCQADGSTITSHWNGSLVDSQTDSAITGNLRTGFWGFSAGGAATRGDSYEAADLVADAGANRRRRVLLGAV